MDQLPALTIEMGLVMALVVFAVFLFITEMLRVDVAAVLIMTLLGLLIYVPGLEGLIPPEVLYSGLSSNAVVSIMAVMILGAGLDKTGAMDSVAMGIMAIGGRTESRIMALVSGAVALISSFMQNVGATALFLPVVSRIASRTGLSMSRLVMPMGFCAILGGTITMVASSPLIMLNDLLAHANESLPAEQAMAPFGLFSVAPVGLALVAAGLVYFLLFKKVLLRDDTESGRMQKGRGTIRYLRRVHGMEAAVREIEVPVGSPLVGRDIKTVQREFEVRIVASRYAGKVLVCPPVEAMIAAPATLAVIAQPDELKHFLRVGGLVMRPKLKEFRHLLARSIAGVAEMIIPPDSKLVGQSVRDVRLRMTYGLSLLSVFRQGRSITTRLQDIPLEAGDTLVCHTRWEQLARLENDRDFVVVTTDYPKVERKPYKVAMALTFFLLALTLILFTDVLLPVALMTGAMGMIIAGVLTMDEAYAAISWKTVFLLAGLLPLGHAVEVSGTAGFLAQMVVNTLGSVPIWVLQALVAILATAFSLVMSNVGATVLLVPIAINLALAAGRRPGHVCADGGHLHVQLLSDSHPPG